MEYFPHDDYDGKLLLERLAIVSQIWEHLESHWNNASDQLGWHVYYALVDNAKANERYTAGMFDIMSLDLVRDGLRLLGWTDEQVT
jgi:hypothetical protein